MIYSSFIINTSLEITEENNKDIFKDYLNNYRFIRKQAGEPSYIIGNINHNYRYIGRIPVVIGY